ncbi:WcbI family polysaccharide biosynthesis putative acetyltransferase [Methylobacterium sp. Leaf466]|uniref:WcbI family polysaccharide biosynthesis putative acetyltransferase n=1 Tax=Methylobacterium sp. Leaf466 TaxID=1736386 RepID=UPI0006F52972|nr:WcbI family polysaccharide biosynthesis putative acetyltransferase [Methylobacterium sp. Leaf466]KQT84334.1 hypothetical protein ASG59_02820 [Methylobacterium sp. Leaf466]
MPIIDVLRRVQRGALSRLAPESATGSPRILVIGICQGAAVARAMRLILPGASVTFVSAFSAAKTFARMSDLVEAAQESDVVFANTYLPAFKDGGDIETLRASANLILMPSIVFPAFHPDLVHIGEEVVPGDGNLLVGPMGRSHSALALFGFRAGLDPDETRRLFTAAVYRRLGYFDGWTESVAFLRLLGEQTGYDLEADLARWTRRGCFMHATNHPKMYVAADLARGLLDKAGIAYGDCDLDAYLADEFIRLGTWPVYPEIAEYYGVPGSALFLSPEFAKTGRSRTMSLSGFIAESYGLYAQRSTERLVCARVDAWLADPAIHADLVAAARDGLAWRPATGLPVATAETVPA